MELNYWIYKDNKENVEKIASQLKKQKMNTNNTISFYSLVIGYLADKKDANALEYLEELKNNYKSVSNPKQEFLINDCDMTCKIYINQDIDLIPVIEKILKENLDNEARSVYQYRLAYLYKLNNNIDKCKNLLKEAMNNTSSIKSKEHKQKPDQIPSHTQSSVTTCLVSRMTKTSLRCSKSTAGVSVPDLVRLLASWLIVLT